MRPVPTMISEQAAPLVAHAQRNLGSQPVMEVSGNPAALPHVERPLEFVLEIHFGIEEHHVEVS